MSNFLKSTLLHPFLFAFFPIVFIFSINVDVLEFNEVIIPLVTIGIVTLILLFLIRLFLKKEKGCSNVDFKRSLNEKML